MADNGGMTFASLVETFVITHYSSNAGNCRQRRYSLDMADLAYVERSGMSKQAVIQMALASWLEDAEDLELIERRRSEGAFLSLDEAERALEL